MSQKTHGRAALAPSFEQCCEASTFVDFDSPCCVVTGHFRTKKVFFAAFIIRIILLIFQRATDLGGRQINKQVDGADIF